MKCKDCNAIITDEHKFCSNCGKQVLVKYDTIEKLMELQYGKIFCENLKKQTESKGK
jgi:hypothetical protein